MSGNNSNPNNPSNLAAVLEADTLTYIRVAGIFFVATCALYSLTEKGKIFAMITGIVSLILLITITTYYFVERNKLSKYGHYTKTPLEVLMYSMIAIIILNIWILYEIWTSDSTSLAKLAQDIEDQVKQANIQDIAKQIEKQVELSNIQNKMLIEAINGKKIDINQIPSPSSLTTPDMKGPILQAPDTASGLRNIEKIRNTVNSATLASVS